MPQPSSSQSPPSGPRQIRYRASFTARVTWVAHSRWPGRDWRAAGGAKKGPPAAWALAAAGWAMSGGLARWGGGIWEGRIGAGLAASAPDTSSTTARPAAAHAVRRRCLDNTTRPLYPRPHQRNSPRSLRRPVRGAGGNMYQYLYAIADRLPAAWRPPDASVGGPVELRRLGDLVVLVSALEQPPEANARTLAVHHDVVASTLDASGTVPFRFGVVVDAADLDAWLAAHAPLVNTT